MDGWTRDRAEDWIRNTVELHGEAVPLLGEEVRIEDPIESECPKC